jgi:molecular chaperone DnaK
MAENLVYQSEKVMKESGEKIPAANRQAVEKAATDLKDALKSNDAERIKSGQQALNDALQAASQELYKNVGHNAQQQQPPPAGEASSADAGAGAPPPSDKKEDGVIDADYTMVDEEKKRKK